MRKRCFRSWRLVTKGSYLRVKTALLAGILANLLAEGIEESLVEQVVSEYQTLGFAKAEDRHILGSMNDIAKMFEFFVASEGGWKYCDLREITKKVNQTPMKVLHYGCAADCIHKILDAKSLEKRMFYSFLQKYCEHVEKISEDEIKDILSESLTAPQLTIFQAVDDTYLYSLLVSKLLHIFDPSKITTVIDLGAGSSIPTIKALLENHQHQGLKVIAVDNDHDAIMTSQKNATENGLNARYMFVEKDIF